MKFSSVDGEQPLPTEWILRHGVISRAGLQWNMEYSTFLASGVMG
jgi:hypothetical protein